MIGMALAQAALLGLGSAVSNGQEYEPTADDEGAQVLTRGPVHEAFAGIVSYNPEPGVIVDRAPPEAIEELPPSERPEGDNINWIPGYWAWDDEGSDYLWVSGTWRALPPGRQWTTGYWGQSEQGHQWISGYWADATERETTYLPRPPATVEVGPNIEAPSRDHVWSPGSWMWQQERYAWRPGYWAEGRNDWDWTPSHYVWTPRGHVHVEGYWDYSMGRRGVVYAPVRFQAGYYSRPGYQYSPVIAIGLAALVDNLFLRPSYHHYYFGDYYDRRYSNSGYYSPFAYQSKRYGYDPVYSYQRWTHRDDNDWERRQMASYDYRRDNASARPPRTWMDQRRMKMDKMDEKDRRNNRMATPFNEMVRQSDSKMRVQTISANERQKLADQSREVRKNRDERRSIEKEGARSSGDKAEREMKPSKAQRPASPIVGRSRDQFSEKQGPPKPRDSNDDRKKDPSDTKKNPDKDGPDKSKDQPNPRRDDDKSDKGPERNQNPDKDRAGPKQEQQNPRRDEAPRAQDPERKASPDKVRPETKKEQSPPRREATPKEPARKARPDNGRTEGNPSNKVKEQRQPKQSDDRNQKTDKSTSDKKVETAKEEDGLSEEEEKKKKRNKQ